MGSIPVSTISMPHAAPFASRRRCRTRHLAGNSARSIPTRRKSQSRRRNSLIGRPPEFRPSRRRKHLHRECPKGARCRVLRRIRRCRPIRRPAFRHLSRRFGKRMCRVASRGSQRSQQRGPQPHVAACWRIADVAGVRCARDSRGLPDPAAEDQRQAAGLDGQRRDDAKAAERDRRALALLRERLLEYPSRRPHTRRPRDRRLRKGARKSAVVPRRIVDQRNRFRPRHDRRHQPGRQHLRPEVLAAGRRNRALACWSITRKSCPGRWSRRTKAPFCASFP